MTASTVHSQHIFINKTKKTLNFFIFFTHFSSMLFICLSMLCWYSFLDCFFFSSSFLFDTFFWHIFSRTSKVCCIVGRHNIHNCISVCITSFTELWISAWCTQFLFGLNTFCDINLDISFIYFSSSSLSRFLLHCNSKYFLLTIWLRIFSQKWNKSVKWCDNVPWKECHGIVYLYQNDHKF